MHLVLSQTAGASLIHEQECMFECFRLAVSKWFGFWGEYEKDAYYYYLKHDPALTV